MPDGTKPWYHKNKHLMFAYMGKYDIPEQTALILTNTSHSDG